MTSNFLRWAYTNNHVITSAIPLIIILFGTQADVIDQPKISDLPIIILWEDPETLCLAAYNDNRVSHFRWNNQNIIKKCHPGYTNVETIEKCQIFNETDFNKVDFNGTAFINNGSLFSAMTNKENNVTYLNIYCAICNFEKELFKFKFWSPWLLVEEDRYTFRTVNSIEMLDKLKVDDSNGSNLISTFNEDFDWNTYNNVSTVMRVVPNRLKIHLPLCIYYEPEDYIINHAVYNCCAVSITWGHPETLCLAAYSQNGVRRLHKTYRNFIKKCHPGYTNTEIIEKCKDFKETDFINDTALFIPVTSKENYITYFNICNFEKELFKFESWTPWLFFEINKNESIENISIPSQFIQPVNSIEVLDKLKVDDSNGSNLISVFNEKIYRCKVLRVAPNRLKMREPFCVYEYAHYIPIIQIIPRSSFDTPIRRILYRIVNSNYPNPIAPLAPEFSKPEPSSMKLDCDYKDEYGDTCSINRFLQNHFHCYNGFCICDEDGYILWESSRDKKIRARCSNHTSNRNHIYVCGPSEYNLYKNIKKRVFDIMDNFSTFFLFLYLVQSTRKQNLRSLPKRILYFYSMTLFALYVLHLLLQYEQLCVKKFYLFYYTWQSHLFWILITSFDLFHLVYKSSKMQKVNVEKQTTRYVFYCILGWGLPALPLIALFPTLTQDQKLWSCPFVLGFENELTCSLSYDFNKYITLYFGWVMIAIFLIVTPVLLVLTCVLLYLSMRNRMRSNVNRTYTIVLLKVSVMMGLHWTLLVYLILFNSFEKFSEVYEFMSSFHGCFIFFAFGMKKNWNRFKRFVSIRRNTKETPCKSARRNQNTRFLPEQAEQSAELKELNSDA